MLVDLAADTGDGAGTRMGAGFGRLPAVGSATGGLALVIGLSHRDAGDTLDGRGLLVAGTVLCGAAVVVAGLAVVAVVTWRAIHGTSCAVAFGIAVTVGVWSAALLQRRAIRRLGGVTGDVLGTPAEAAMTHRSSRC